MVIPVILSGGPGSRLWPVSREAHPKPFIKLADGQTLLEKTFLRAHQLENISEIIISTNREYYFKTKDEHEKIKNKSTPLSFVLEPCARNTAAAITMAAFKAAKDYGDDAILFILSADHLINNQAAFEQAYKTACELAETNKIITLGIKPTHPETGYGYIECSSAIENNDAFHVTQFTEKPDLKTAQQYINTGRYLWNAGIFCFKAGVLLEQLKKYKPDFYKQALHCWETTCSKPNALSSTVELDENSFAQLENISIDFALLEKTKDILVVPAKFDWNDIGSWDAVSRLANSDQQGNVVAGEAVLVDVHNTFIQSEDRLIASVGVKNLLIIDTPDALLVADRDHAQDVKQVVQQLKNIDHVSYKISKTMHRPWGTYTVLEEGQNFKIKRIVVKPHASLSLQMHHHRSEHWVVVSGTAKVVNGDQEIALQPNESTFIPAGHQHRLANPGTTDLIIIEVQTGNYLGEDDIVRFEDKYGRT